VTLASSASTDIDATDTATGAAGDIRAATAITIYVCVT